MKSILILTSLALPFSAIANENHHSGGHYTCSAKDGLGRVFSMQGKIVLYDYSWPEMPQPNLKYRVLKQCRSQSARPDTCRPLGCRPS